MNILLSYADFIALTTAKNLRIQYTETEDHVAGHDYESSTLGAYTLYAVDIPLIYKSVILKDAGDDVTDFEDNYKDNANTEIVPRSADGRPLTIAVSRPRRYQTSFTTRCDDLVNSLVGKGKAIWWDFSNSDDEVTAPSGYKRKRIELQWIDPVYLKEGTLYFHNALKGSYFDLYIVCPDGQYFLKNDGTPELATEDTPFAQYINHHFFQGDCSMGDELNTETATEDPLPTNYKVWVEITVPESDTSSNGYGELEVYRQRTITI